MARAQNRPKSKQSPRTRSRGYSAIRATLKTGDIVLFSGKGHFSNLIKLGTFSKWSHVGMVLKLPEYDFLTLWESTGLTDIEDLDTNKPNVGVQLVPLSARGRKYSGDIAYRSLKGPALADTALADLMKLRRKLKGRKYEKSKVELVKAAWDSVMGHNQEEDLSSVFCSELVAEAYQSLKLIDGGKNSNEYTPADFMQGRLDTLAGGRTLGPEVTIKDV